MRDILVRVKSWFGCPPNKAISRTGYTLNDLVELRNREWAARGRTGPA